MLNEEVITDSKSDNADDYIGLTSVACEKAQSIVARKRTCLAQRVQRLNTKTLDESKFLS